MKLLFKQRFLSWLDSYDIYDEDGRTLFSVEGKVSWGHKLHILDSSGDHIATLKQAVFTLMPQFELYIQGRLVGTIAKEFTWFKPSYRIDCNGWSVAGDFLEWDYTILDGGGATVATIGKELFHLTDTYVIDVANPDDALYALLVTLAIDAEKCARN